MWTRQKYPCKTQRIKHMQGLRYFIATDGNFHEKVSLKYCRISCLEKARHNSDLNIGAHMASSQSQPKKTPGSNLTNGMQGQKHDVLSCCLTPDSLILYFLHSSPVDTHSLDSFSLHNITTMFHD